MKAKLASFFITCLMVTVIGMTALTETFFAEHPWIMLGMLFWVVNKTATKETKERVVYQILSIVSSIGIVYLIVCLNWFEGTLSQLSITLIVSVAMVIYAAMLSIKCIEEESKNEWETSIY